MTDPLADALSRAALDALQYRIETTVEQKLREALPAAIENARVSPWLDAKSASQYLHISENALRLRVRADLVPAHRDRAGRLRFHRDELDRTMTRVDDARQ